MGDDTNPISGVNKKCSRCSDIKSIDLFIKERNICKKCNNFRTRAKYLKSKESVGGSQVCNTCSDSKDISEFIKNRNICKTCNNNKRRTKYENDDDHRKKLIQRASTFKHDKVIDRQLRINLNAEIIGLQNKKCEYCYEIKSSEKFRFNRLRCRDCERDEPVGKFKRCVRSRIYIALKRNKTKRTIKYLGCTNNEYFDWIMTYNENYNLENYGNVWHIDHVIPISKFNLDNEDEQSLAFNWRNTMPLSAQDNLKKGSKIINLQVAKHMEKLQEYHENKNIEIPEKYIELFARHLVVRERPKVITTTL
jgi:uncharacterized protein (DUF983 family)